MQEPIRVTVHGRAACHRLAHAEGNQRTARDKHRTGEQHATFDVRVRYRIEDAVHGPDDCHTHVNDIWQTVVNQVFDPSCSASPAFRERYLWSSSYGACMLCAQLTKNGLWRTMPYNHYWWPTTAVVGCQLACKPGTVTCMAVDINRYQTIWRHIMMALGGSNAEQVWAHT